MDLPVSASYWDEENAEEEASVSDADDVVLPENEDEVIALSDEEEDNIFARVVIFVWETLLDCFLVVVFTTLLCLLLMIKSR